MYCLCPKQEDKPTDFTLIYTDLHKIWKLSDNQDLILLFSDLIQFGFLFSFFLLQAGVLHLGDLDQAFHFLLLCSLFLGLLLFLLLFILSFRLSAVEFFSFQKDSMHCTYKKKFHLQHCIDATVSSPTFLKAFFLTKTIFKKEIVT